MLSDRCPDCEPLTNSVADVSRRRFLKTAAATAAVAALPRITIGGSVGYGRSDSALGSFSGSTWSLGPVSVSLASAAHCVGVRLIPISFAKIVA